VGDQWAVSFALNNLGEVARVLGITTRPASIMKKVKRSCGSWRSGDLARLVHNLGCVAQYDGNFGKAKGLFRESLAMFRKFGNKRGIAECLMGLSGLKAQEGQPQQAARLFSAAEAILAEVVPPGGRPIGPKWNAIERLSYPGWTRLPFEPNMSWDKKCPLPRHLHTRWRIHDHSLWLIS